MREVLMDLLCLSICSKHPSFFEEREVRAGLCFLGNQNESQARSLQPFYEILFSPIQDILRIIIGPHRDQQGRFDFLKSYLSKSEVPLRF
jgi:hypothetical protein